MRGLVEIMLHSYMSVMLIFNILARPIYM